MLWKKLIVGLVSTTGLMFMGGSTAQAETIYSNRADFQAAASGLSFEGFEADFPAGKSISFPGFTLSTDNGNDLRRWDRADLVSEGSWAVGTEISSSEPTHFTFTFDLPLTTFGVDVNDYADSFSGGPAVLTVTNDTDSFAYTLITTTTNLEEGNTAFFGVIDDSPFTSVTFTATGTKTDAIAFDALEFNQIPAPSTLVGLVSMGLVGLVIGLRRRFRKAA